jgi:predicted PurR-regulated permease PerM
VAPAARPRELEGPNLFMKETRHPRRTGADQEHVEKVSARTAMLLAAAAAVLLHLLQWILLPFVVSAVMAYVCTPAIDWLTARSGIPRALIAATVFVALLLLGSLIGVFGVPSLVRELARLLTDFEGTVDALARGVIGSTTVNLLGQPMTAGHIAQAATAGVREWIGQAGHIVSVGSAALVTIFGAFLTLVLLFYFLLNGPGIACGLFRLAPPRQRPLIRHVWSQVDPVLRRYILGVIVVIAYAAVAAYVGLGLILGIPHAVFLALLTGLLEMIPMIGPGAAALIAGLVAIRYANGIGPIIGYAVYATTLRLSIDQILGPIALGAAARVHPVLIILCFLAGGTLFGIAGLILAVPSALIIRTTLAILYDETPAGDRNRQ